MGGTRCAIGVSVDEMPQHHDLLSAAALAAAEASAVAALANASARKRTEESKIVKDAEAAALENLAKAAANVRDVPRAPKAPPPVREAPAPPQKPPTWMERQVLQAATKGKRSLLAAKEEHAAPLADAPWHRSKRIKQEMRK